MARDPPSPSEQTLHNLCLPWAVWGAYLFLRHVEREESWWRSALGMAGGVLLLLIGFRIRATVGILLIALVACGFLTRKQGKLLVITVTAVCYLAVSFAAKGINAYYGVEEDRSIQFPAVHFIMMGANEEKNGWFRDEDVAFSASFHTYEERVSGDLAEWKARLSALGVGGTLKLAESKLSSVWSCGDSTNTTFQSMEHQGRLYQYTGGSHSKFIKYVMQFERCGLMLLMLATVVRDLVSKKRELSPWIVAFFGGVIFYLLWEAHNRYSLSFLPWLFIAVAPTLGRLAEPEPFRWLGREIRWHKAGGWIYACVVLLTIGVLAGAWNANTAGQREYTDVVVYQRNFDAGNIKDMGLAELRQTFAAGGRFNTIELYFLPNDTAENSVYQIDLINAADKVVRSTTFTTDELEEDGRLVFRFDPVSLKKGREFTIRIAAAEAVGEHSLGIRAAGNIDYLPSGTLYLSGEEQAKDLKLIVSNVKTRTYTSEKVYLGCLLLMLAAEYAGFFGLKHLKQVGQYCKKRKDTERRQ